IAPNRLVLADPDTVPTASPRAGHHTYSFSDTARALVITRGGRPAFPTRAGCAGLSNPRTPARPDLKSGAVVLAWLPPRAAHPAFGIMPFRCGLPALGVRPADRRCRRGPRTRGRLSHLRPLAEQQFPTAAGAADAEPLDADRLHTTAAGDAG